MVFVQWLPLIFWLHLAPCLLFSEALINWGADVFVSMSTTPTSPGAQGWEPRLVELQHCSAQGGCGHAEPPRVNQ